MCPHCKKERPTNDYEKKLFKKVLNKEVDKVYIAEGCEKCNSGYLGRIAIHEVLMINEEIKEAISDNLDREKLRELVYNADVTTLLQDGLEKVITGLTTVEELLKIIELENDEKEAGDMNLQVMLDRTDIVNHATPNTHVNNIDEIESIEI